METGIVFRDRRAEKRRASNRCREQRVPRPPTIGSLAAINLLREIDGRGDSLDEYKVVVEARAVVATHPVFADGQRPGTACTTSAAAWSIITRRRTERPLQIDPAEGQLLSDVSIATTRRRAFALRRASVGSPYVRRLPGGGRGARRHDPVLRGSALAGGPRDGSAPRRAGSRSVLAEAWGPLVARGANPLLCIATAAQLTAIQRPVGPGAGPTISSPTWRPGIKACLGFRQRRTCISDLR